MSGEAVERLRKRLQAAQVEPDAYSLDSPARDECYVLERRGEVWAVFYAERGLRTEERLFPGEEEACAHLWERIARDSTLDTGARRL